MGACSIGGKRGMRGRERVDFLDAIQHAEQNRTEQAGNELLIMDRFHGSFGSID